MGRRKSVIEELALARQHLGPSVEERTRHDDNPRSRAFRADERATDAAGWALNLAIFRIVYLSLGVSPLAIDTWIWTRRALPDLGLYPGRQRQRG